MKKLDELKDLVSCMNNIEFNGFVSKIKQQKTTGGSNTTVKLLEAIFEQPDITSENLGSKIYGTNNTIALNKLSSRLIEKIDDLLILRENIENNNVYDYRAKSIFILGRQLLIAEIIRFRGLLSLSIDRINEVITKSKYYEHYDILIKALEIKRRWIYTSKNSVDKINLENEIELFNNARKMFKQSEKIYLYIYRMKYENYNVQSKKYLFRSINKLSQFYKITKSKQIKIILYYVKIQLSTFSAQYHKALEICKELCDYILLNQDLYSKQRYGNSLLNKGVIERFCFNFENSIQTILETKKYFTNFKYNNVIVYEELMLTYYFSGNLSKSRYYLTLIERECLPNNFSFFNKVLYQYYYSILCFSSSEFEKISNLLQESFKKSDSFYLNIECRILLSLLYIEKSKLDLADYEIENLRKYFSRFKSKYSNYHLKEIMIKILIKLSYYSYDFKKVLANEKLNLIELNKNLNKFSFNNYEMIIFHEWFDAKVKNIPYDHAEIMKRLKKKNKVLA
jgi:hypothetical protein